MKKRWRKNHAEQQGREGGTKPETSAGKQAGASVSTVQTVTQETSCPKDICREGVHRGSTEQEMRDETENVKHTVLGEVSCVDVDVFATNYLWVSATRGRNRGGNNF